MDKWVYNYLIELKALREKKKPLVTSNFSFSNNVFKSCLLLMRQNEYLWSTRIKKTFSSMLHIYREVTARCFSLQSVYFDLAFSDVKHDKKVRFLTNIQQINVGKGQIVYNRHFLLFPQYFQ